MKRKTRIILILVVGILVGGLVIAVSLPGKDGDASGVSFWDRLSCACDELFVKLGLRSENRCGRRNVRNACINNLKAFDAFACIENLKRIEAAKATWALQTRTPRLDIPAGEDPYGENGYIRDEPKCPAGGKYLLGNAKEKAHCSIPGHTL